MSSLENVVIYNTNVENDNETLLISIALELNKLTSNYPDFDCSSLSYNITSLANTVESLTVQNNDLILKNVDLECEISRLNSSFEQFKMSKQIELNDSFNIQDQVVEQNDAISRELVSYKNKCVKLQASICNLRNENEILKLALADSGTKNLDTNISPSSSNDSVKCVLLEKEKMLNCVNNKLNDALKDKEYLSCELKKHKNMSSRLRAMVNDKWLDDSTIQSYFRALNECDKSVSTRSLFVDPVISELLKHGSSETCREQLTSLKFDTFQFVFFCVNDSNNTVYSDTDDITGNGSHWSLLFVSNVDKIAYHVDSLNDLNMKHALCLVEKIGFEASRLQSIPCERQNNNFECGLNVLVNAKMILNGFCSKPGKSNTNFVKWSSQFFDCTSGENGSTQQIIETVSQSVVVDSKVPPKIKLKKISSNEWKVVGYPKKNQKSKIATPNQCTDIPLKNIFSILDTLPPKEVPTRPASGSNSLPISNDNPISTKTNHNVKQCNIDKMCTTVPSRSKSCVKIFSDSHGRHISSMLGNRTTGIASVFGLVKPNAKFTSVLASAKAETASMGTNDKIIVMAGTNDFVNGRCNDFTVELDGFLGSVSEPRVVIVGVPFRYDVPSLNREISKVNLQVKDIVTKHNNSVFISLEAMPRMFFTRHGLHLNSRGKSSLTDLLYNAIHFQSVPNICQEFPSHKSKVTPYKPRKSIHLSQPQNSRHSVLPTIISKCPQSRTFQNRHFLGAARKPPGVPWSLYVARVIGASGALSK